MTANRDLAERARQLADRAPRGSFERKVAGCASVALTTTTTTAGARKALREWDGPADIRGGAVKLLDQLEGR